MPHVSFADLIQSGTPALGRADASFARGGKPPALLIDLGGARDEVPLADLHDLVRDRVRGNDANPVNLVYVGLGLVGIVLAIIVLLLVSGFRLPRLW